MIYANDNDKSAAHWLSCLPLGLDTIDSRSIADVKGSDLVGFTQCHFFAGIGGWPYALQLAGWPADAPVWTGSCPCQPFSCAGKGKGTDDDRHLWPEFRRLIDECRPAVVFGEQVASKAGRNWLAVVRADLEALGYGVGAADLSAAGAGAFHIRQRLFWAAYIGGRSCCGSKSSSFCDTVGECGQCGRVGIQQRDALAANGQLSAAIQGASFSGDVCGVEAIGPVTSGSSRLGDTESDRRKQRRAESDGRNIATANGRMADANSNGCNQAGQCLTKTERYGSIGDGANSGLGHTTGIGSNGRVRYEPSKSTGDRSGLSPGSGYWNDVEFIPCRDGKARPVKPGVRLLAHGVPGRVAQLRGLGNAIVPQVAAIFIASFIDAITHRTVEA